LKSYYKSPAKTGGLELLNLSNYTGSEVVDL